MSAQVIDIFSGFPRGDVAEVVAEALEAGERVVAGDPQGDVVPAGDHPVRVLTAAIDYLWGWRDLLRGPKTLPRSRYGMFGPNCRLEEYDKGWWNA
jgi:hypothetical protein